MAARGSVRGRGVRTRGGRGRARDYNDYNDRYERFDSNRFVYLNQDGGNTTTGDSDTNDDLFEPVPQRGKRQRISTGGASNSDDIDQQLNFDNLPHDEKLSALFSRLAVVDVKVDSLTDMNKRLGQAETVIKSHSDRLKLLEYRSIDIEARSRRNNIIYRNLDEAENEDCVQVINSFNYHELNLNSTHIERAHRLGRKVAGQNRPLIVCYRDYTDTDRIMRQAPNLKGSRYSVSRDYPPEITDARRSIWPYFKQARDSQKYRDVSIGYPAKLILNGKVVQDMFPDWFHVLRGSRVDSKHFAEMRKQQFLRESPPSRYETREPRSEGPRPHQSPTHQTLSAPNTAASATDVPATPRSEGPGRRDIAPPQRLHTPNMAAPDTDVTTTPNQHIPSIFPSADKLPDPKVRDRSNTSRRGRASPANSPAANTRHSRSRSTHPTPSSNLRKKPASGDKAGNVMNAGPGRPTTDRDIGDHVARDNSPVYSNNGG